MGFDLDGFELQIGKHLAACDAVIHLAYLVSGYYRRALADSVNIEGSKNIFTQAADAGVEVSMPSSVTRP